MVLSFKKLLLTGLTLVLSIGALTASAHAGDNCKDVDIKVKNSSSNHIKVTKIQYYDYDASKWRNEVTALTRKINPGQHYTFNRNLEHVDNDDTKIKITYKIQSGGSRWGSAKTKTSSKFVCKDHSNHTITVN